MHVGNLIWHICCPLGCDEKSNFIQLSAMMWHLSHAVTLLLFILGAQGKHFWMMNR